MTTIAKTENGICIIDENRIIEVEFVDNDILGIIVTHKVDTPAGILGESVVINRETIAVFTKMRRSLLELILNSLTSLDEKDYKFSDEAIAKCLKCKFKDTCDKPKGEYARNISKDS